MEGSVIDLSRYRLEKAKEDLDLATGCGKKQIMTISF